MNFARDRTNMAANAAFRFKDETYNFLIQRWPPGSLAAFSSDFQAGQCPLLDQRALELSDGHEHPEL